MKGLIVNKCFKKSPEEQVDCSGQAARKRGLENSSMAVYWNRRSSGSAMQRLMTNAYYPFDPESEEAIYRKCF